MHGRTSTVYHDGQGLFRDLPSPLLACRYHSLVVDPATLPGEFEITARTQDGTIMAIAHRKRPVYGVQFHPEAVLTEHGYAMLANFLVQAGQPVPERLPTAESERPQAGAEWSLPAEPVTF
jgi:anthranilate synthase/aminodeoxychorismate synthase-like glutamine amidotransferase